MKRIVELELDNVDLSTIVRHWMPKDLRAPRHNWPDKLIKPYFGFRIDPLTTDRHRIECAKVDKTGYYSQTFGIIHDHKIEFHVWHITLNQFVTHSFYAADPMFFKNLEHFIRSVSWPKNEHLQINNG